MLLLIFLAVPSVLGENGNFDEIFQNCRSNGSLSQQEYEEVNNYDVTKDGEMQYKYQCYLKCIYLALKVMNEDGTLNPENEMVSADITSPVYPCFKIYTLDSCNTAYEFTKCFNYHSQTDRWSQSQKSSGVFSIIFNFLSSIIAFIISLCS